MIKPLQGRIKLSSFILRLGDINLLSQALQFNRAQVICNNIGSITDIKYHSDSSKVKVFNGIWNTVLISDVKIVCELDIDDCLKYKLKNQK